MSACSPVATLRTLRRFNAWFDGFTPEGPATGAPLSVNVSGYLRDESGWGAAARGYVRALRRLGVPTGLAALVAATVTPLVLGLLGKSHAAWLMAALTLLVYISHRTNIGRILRGIPLVGETADEMASRMKDAVKQILEPATVFDALDLKYTGRIDGHDPVAISEALEAAQTSDRPSLIACRTVIGYGAPNKQGGAGVHGAPLGAEEVAAARRTLGWSPEPFHVPTEIRDAWRIIGLRGCRERRAWQARLERARGRR